MNLPHKKHQDFHIKSQVMRLRKCTSISPCRRRVFYNRKIFYPQRNVDLFSIYPHVVDIPREGEAIKKSTYARVGKNAFGLEQHISYFLFMRWPIKTPRQPKMTPSTQKESSFDILANNETDPSPNVTVKLAPSDFLWIGCLTTEPQPAHQLVGLNLNN